MLQALSREVSFPHGVKDADHTFVRVLGYWFAVSLTAEVTNPQSIGECDGKLIQLVVLLLRHPFPPCLPNTKTARILAVVLLLIQACSNLCCCHLI